MKGKKQSQRSKKHNLYISNSNFFMTLSRKNSKTMPKLICTLSFLFLCLSIYSYAGVLFGMTNTSATITGMTAPLVVGYLTPNVSVNELCRNVILL